MTIIEILTWVSVISGVVVILLMLISLVAGSELDIEMGDGDADTGSLGILKGGLIFIAVATWMIKTVMVTDTSLYLAIVAGIVSGSIAVAILSWFFKLLLRNQENVNWSPDEAIGKTGKVYLTIPQNKSGIIKVNINGTTRELKAKTTDKKDIPTGAEIFINDYDKGFVIVSRLD